AATPDLESHPRRLRKKKGRPKPPLRRTNRGRGLEGHLQREPELTRSGLRRGLPVVRVVRARTDRRRRALVAERADRAGLDARLTVEGARRIRDERGARVEALVDGRRRLPVEELEDVRLRRDGHRADVEVVAEREVHLVVGREATRVAALRDVELLRIEAVVVALDRRRNAGADVELDTGREAPRRVVDGVEAALVRPVELETSRGVLEERGVVVVGVDAGVRLARGLADGARVVARERRA